MAEEKTQGQMEEPQTQQTPTEEVKDVDAFMAELEKAGVSTPSELQGKLINAQGFNKVQSERDSLARELETLRGEISQLKSNRQQASNWDEYDNPGSTINIEDVVVKAIRKERVAEREQQMQAQQAMMKDWARIQGDEDYHLIKDIWEDKLKDPSFVYKINSGQVSPVDEYSSTLRTYYKNMLIKAGQTINGLKGTTPVASQPNLEQEGTYAVPKENIKPENTKFEQLSAKAQKGQLSEQDELDLLDETLGELK